MKKKLFGGNPCSLLILGIAALTDGNLEEQKSMFWPLEA